jgi:hypothetical protein
MNIVAINWKSDSLNTIRAKQQLAEFLQEQKELKGKSDKIDAYHEKRIAELKSAITSPVS